MFIGDDNIDVTRADKLAGLKSLIRSPTQLMKKIDQMEAQVASEDFEASKRKIRLD